MSSCEVVRGRTHNALCNTLVARFEAIKTGTCFERGASVGPATKIRGAEKSDQSIKGAVSWVAKIFLQM
jgi:hypothetical protein